MEKSRWTEQHSQLWATPKRSTSSPSPSAGHSAADQSLEKVETAAQLSTSQIVREILGHLEGANAVQDTRETSLQDDLYRILMKLEGCEESVETALGRMKVNQYGSSLTEKTRALEDATATLTDASSLLPDAHDRDVSTSHRVVDVLRAYGDIETEADTGAVLLSILKDYERLKREAVQREEAVREQEAQVNWRLSFYGEPAFGRDGHTEMVEHWRPWIETPLTFLYEEVSKALASVGELAACNVTEPFLSDHAEESRENIAAVLNSAMTCVERLRVRLSQGPPATLFPLRSDCGTSSVVSDDAHGACFSATVRVLIGGLPPAIVSEFRLDQLFECESAELPEAVMNAIHALVTRREGGTDKSLFIINSLGRSLKRAFHLSPDGSDAALSLTTALQDLEKTVADVLAYPHESPQRESELKREVCSAVDELAQLLPTSSEGALPISSGIRIEPPTSSLTEIVQLLKTRFLAWSQRQQKQLLTGAHSRSERDRTLDMATRYLRDLHSIAQEMSAIRAADGSPSTEKAGPEGLTEGHTEPCDTPSPAFVEAQLSSLQDRLRSLKTQYVKTSQDAASLRSRLEASTQRNAAQAKCLKRAAGSATKLCEALRVDDSCLQELARKEADGDKSTQGDQPARLSLRPMQDRSSRGKSTSAEVTEATLVDALRAIEVRVSSDADLMKKSEAEHEEEQAAARANKYEKDKAAFADAMRMILLRLAESGKLVKQSLFMLGTDESADDDAITDALSLLDKTGDDGTRAGGDHENVERLLAALLQKYSRWSRRLCETTEDHLVTQQKIVKYFTAIRRFFSPPEGDGAAGADTFDENLIDIDTSLMRSADVILPALDRAIRATDGGQNLAATAGDRGDAHDDPDARRKEAVGHLAALSSSKSTVLPYDHRLGRLYDMINRLYTTVTSLQRVRYLAIPADAKRRSSGDVELTFDDGYTVKDYIDLDLDKLIAGTASDALSASPPARFTRQDATSMSSAVQGSGSSTMSTRANDDRILQVATQNLDCVQQALKKFSSDHKLGAIIIQKDTDTMQQLLAGMLEKYSELDVEKAFGQDRTQLRELYTVLHDRAARQKGCYFFNRVGGEGRCAWTSALEQLSTGFNGIIDKLIQRTDLATKYRDLIDDVVDLCAMFVNWSAQHPLPPGHELPKEVLDDCVHEGSADDSDTDRGGRTTLPSAAPRALLPPMLPRPGVPAVSAGASKGPSAADAAACSGSEAARLVVSHFHHDETVVKVIEKMFRLVQGSSESGAAIPPAAAAGSTPSREEEELMLLRETVAVADQRAMVLSEEKRMVELDRDKARSEAAVARAELRRLLKDGLPAVATTPAPQLLPRHTSAAVESVSMSGMDAATPQSSSRTATNSIDQDCLEELLQYMKVLGRELQYGKSVARSEGALPSQRDGDSDEAYFAERQRFAAPVGAGSGEVESSIEDERETWDTMPGADGEVAHDTSASPVTRLRRLKALEQRLQEEYHGPLLVEVTESRRGEGGVATNGERRYSPSKHRGGDYEVCEGCVRHHRQPMPTGLQTPREGTEATAPAAMRAVADRDTGKRPTATTPRSRPQTSGGVPPSSSRTPQRTRPRLGTASPAPARTAWTTSHRDAPAIEPERFFDDDVHARATLSNSQQHRAAPSGPPRTGADTRPASARRAHPLRTAPLTPRPAGRSYDDATANTRAAAAMVSPYMPAATPFRGTTSHSGRRSDSVRASRPTAQAGPRVGRARSPDHFGAALQSVQAAGRQRPGDDYGINTSPRPQGDPFYPDSANLRSAALRRLAEVVSQTKVKGPGGRYY